MYKHTIIIQIDIFWSRKDGNEGALKKIEKRGIGIECKGDHNGIQK
jgi:hypothetical protein